MPKINIYETPTILTCSAAIYLGLTICSDAVAADVPNLRKKIEYVKVCAVYGAGFYYIPETDTCLKVGGYVRFDTYINSASPFNPFINSTAAAGFSAGKLGFPFRDPEDPDYITRTRAVMSFDARTQTEYGTLRSLFSGGMQYDSATPAGGPGSSIYIERMLIQFAGLTAGYTQSFFDTGTSYSYVALYAGSNTWTNLLAYTADLGGGISATISLESAADRTAGVQMTGSTPQNASDIDTNGTGLSYTNYSAGQSAPDIVTNLRVDQSWGWAQFSGALHRVDVKLPLYAGFGTDRESSKWGWAVGAAVEVQLPMISPGDSIFFQAGYEQGGSNYLGLVGFGAARSVGIGKIELTRAGGSLVADGAYYPVADAVATDTSGNFDLTSGWSIQGQYRHFWTPGLRSAVFAGYVEYEAPPNIVAAQDFNVSQAGFNTIWSPVKGLDIGAEVMYTKVDGATPLGNYSSITSSGGAQGSLVGGSADIWSGGIRVLRRF